MPEPEDRTAAGADPAAGGDPDAATEPTEADATETTEATAQAGARPDVADVEGLIAGLEAVTAERDAYLDQLRRNQAEFENARRRLMRQAEAAGDSAAARLVETLLPVLDACDSAIGHGATEVEPIFAALLGTLEKEGLGRVAEPGAPFDPNVHEAVFHEPAEDGEDGTVVTEVMRPGYTWGERTLRPAMVKVRG